MRYYFDSLNGGRHRDLEGQELPSIEKVQDEAVHALVDMGRDELANVRSGKLAVKVRDETGRIVLVATLTLAIELSR